VTLGGLVVEGVILLVRDAHVAVVESTLIDVAIIADNNTDHVTVDVINSTWTSRGPNDVTSCEVGASTDSGRQPTAELPDCRYSVHCQGRAMSVAKRSPATGSITFVRLLMGFANKHLYSP